MALWLPTQGYGAVAMPFCQHSMAMPSVQPSDAEQSRHHDGHPGHMTQTDTTDNSAGLSSVNHVNGDGAGKLGCDNCGACHLACSPAISAIASVHLLAGNSALESAPADTPHFFYPEQLQRPPLPALT